LKEKSPAWARLGVEIAYSLTLNFKIGASFLSKASSCQNSGLPVLKLGLLCCKLEKIRNKAIFYFCQISDVSDNRCAASRCFLRLLGLFDRPMNAQ
jgi:hypothetical protein